MHMIHLIVVGMVNWLEQIIIGILSGVRRVWRPDVASAHRCRRWLRRRCRCRSTIHPKTEDKMSLCI